MGKYVDALGLYEQALTMRVALFKGNHMDVAQSLNNVGVANGRLGKYMHALKYKEQALAM